MRGGDGLYSEKVRGRGTETDVTHLETATQLPPLRSSHCRRVHSPRMISFGITVHVLAVCTLLQGIPDGGKQVSTHLDRLL